MKKFKFKILYDKKSLLFFILLLALFLCIGAALYILNPVQLSMEEIYFYDLNGNRMTGQYIEGEKDRGVILAPDKGQDMSYYVNLARSLSKEGYHVMLFDLPGQGRSQGAYTTTFYEDNSSAMQTYSAMLAFSQLSKLPPVNIHYIGHGFGARAVLQASALDYIQPASMTLINPEISFKSTIFARLPIIVDDPALSWIQNIGTSVVGANIGIISTTSADSENATRLNELLGTQNQVMLTTEQSIFEAYAPMGKNVIRAVVSHVGSVSGLGVDVDEWKVALYNTGLLLFAFGLFAILFYMRKTLEKRRDIQDTYAIALSGEFYLYKLLFWLPALVIGGVGLIVSYVLPVAFPVQAGVVSLMFGSYGIVMFAMYTYSNFANDAGAGMFKDENRSSWLTGVIIFIVAYLLLKIFGHFGLYYMFPFAQRWIWFLVFAFFNSIPFLIIDRELAVLNADRISKFKLVAVYLLPFVLAVPFLALLGLQALAMGMLMALGGMVVVILFGRILEELDVQILIAAGLQGLLFAMYLLSFGIMLA